MAITIVANLVAALLDGFAIALLIPFLNILFHQPSTAMKSGWISKLLDATVGSQIVPGDEMHSLRNVIIVVLIAVILKNLLVWIAGQFGATLQEYVTRDLRNAVYRHLAHLPLGYFTQMKAGQILSRVINDTFETRLILTQIVTQSLQSASLVLVYIAILFSISWKLSLLALIILPLLGVSLQPMLKKLRRGNLRLGNVHGEMTSVLQETISGIRLVKASGTEEYEEARFADGSNKYARSSLRLTRLALLAPSLAWLRSRPWVPLLKLVAPQLGLIQPAPRAVIEAIVRRVIPGSYTEWTAAGIDEFLRSYLTPRGRAAFYAAARNIYLEEPYGPDGFWTRLPELAPESLFVWGRQDQLVPIRFARHVREVLPGAQHLELRCGHVPQLERPKETHDAILRFFDQGQRGSRAAATRAREMSSS